MSSHDQPTIPTSPPNGSRSAQLGWQAPSVEQMQSMLPQYDILDILGRGGMGAVYKGRQKSLKRLVAIKILPLDAADDEMKFVERFQNEAQTMAAMNHPAIVSVHDFGETKDGLLYFIMEFVDGTDVQKMIQASGKLSGEYALAITAHVCDALDYAHKRGVIHRDIKPANILINQEGHVKVADFGLAKMDDPSQTSGLTKTNMAMGTPDYVAPEVLVTGMVADHRADIYAVGVMLYQMLTGEVPRGMFKLPSHKGLGTDPRFDRIICKAMEQDREERYQSAMDVRRALDVILTTPQATDDGTGVVSASQIPQKPVAKQPRPPGEKSAPPQPVAKQQAARKPAPMKKSSPATTWLSIGGIVAVLGVAGFFILSGKPKTTPAEASASASTAKPQSPIKVRENPPAPQMTALAATNGKTIDWLNAVPPEGRPWTADWGGFKDGVLTPTTKFSRMLGTLKDGSVRVRVRRAPASVAAEHPMLAVEFRNSPMPAKATGFGAYQFQVLVPKRTCSLSFEEKEKAGIRGKIDHLWRGDPVVKDELGSDGIEWEFRVMGDEFSAWADGKLIQSARDARLRSGICTIVAAAGMQITRLETTGLTPIKSSTSTKPVADALPSSSGIWTDRLGTMTWVAPWTMKDDVLSTSSGLAIQELGQVSDGAIRVRARVAEGLSVAALKNPVLQPVLRVASVRTGWQGAYQFQVYMPGRACTLIYAERDDQKVAAEMPPVYLWKEKPLPPELIGKREIEWEFRAVGDELSVWADAKLVASARDSRLTAGRSKLQAYPGIEITGLETSGITPRDPSAAVEPSSPQTSVTNPAAPAPAAGGGIDWIKTGKWESPWVLKNGLLASTADDSKFQFGRGGDVAIRFRVREDSARGSKSQVQVDLRLGNLAGLPGRRGSYRFQTNPPQPDCSLMYLETSLDNKDPSPPVFLWNRKPLPVEIASNPEVEWEVRAQGDEISVWADELLVASVRDVRASEGWCNVFAATGIEFVRLETSGITPDRTAVKNPGDLPEITDWQDVTEKAREQARSTKGLRVESDGAILRTSGDTPPGLTLTPPDQRDYAVRVRYTGEAQVNVRSQNDGFLFVLCQKNQTLFKRLRPGEKNSDDIGAIKPHPPGFDPTREHELLVTMKGSVLSAWMDGVFIGEAHDDTLTDGTAALMFVPKMVVKKVEVGKLVDNARGEQRAPTSR